MSLPKAERTFQSLVSDQRPEVVHLLKNWEPSHLIKTVGCAAHLVQQEIRMARADIDKTLRRLVKRIPPPVQCPKLGCFDLLMNQYGM